MLRYATSREDLVRFGENINMNFNCPSQKAMLDMNVIMHYSCKGHNRVSLSFFKIYVTMDLGVPHDNIFSLLCKVESKV